MPYGGALPLVFGGQRFAGPAGIGARLRLTDIDWPIQRQGNFLEHRSIQPLIADLFSRMPDEKFRWCFFQSQVSIAPEDRVAVTAGVDEFEILAIGDFVLIDLEGRERDGMGFELVIPAELFAVAGKTERTSCRRGCHTFDVISGTSWGMQHRGFAAGFCESSGN